MVKLKFSDFRRTTAEQAHPEIDRHIFAALLREAHSRSEGKPARLLGVGVRWLVSVLTAAMALKHLGVGGTLVDLAFGILFGGIVLALALAVGLGSRDLVTRTLERQKEQAARDSTDSLSHF